MSRERASRRFYRVESEASLVMLMDRGLSAAQQNRWIFEIAWEVANKGNLLIQITFSSFLYIIRVRVTR